MRYRPLQEPILQHDHVHDARLWGFPVGRTVGADARGHRSDARRSADGTARRDGHLANYLAPVINRSENAFLVTLPLYPCRCKRKELLLVSVFHTAIRLALDDRVLSQEQWNDSGLAIES